MTRQGLLKQIQRRNEPLKRIAELEEQNSEAKEIIGSLIKGVVIKCDDSPSGILR